MTTVPRLLLTSEERLQRLRDILHEFGIDAYVIPTADAHASECPPDTDKRRMYMTGFTGSAGTAVVTRESALLWTDSRYYEQAAQELENTSWVLMKERLATVPSIPEWLAKNDAVQSVGYDPLITPISFHERLLKKLSESTPSKILLPVEPNLVDEVWKMDGKPAPPSSELYLLPPERTGQSTLQKLAKIRDECSKNHVDGCVLSLLDDIAWVTNIRGSDIPYSPVFMAYMLITSTDAWLYADSERIPNDCVCHLRASNIELKPYASIFQDLRQRFGHASWKGKLWLDGSANMKLCSSVYAPSNNVLLKRSPAQLPKAIKTAEELAGMKEAHVKDAMAKVTFLAWLENLAEDSTALRQETEWTVAQHLDDLRKMMPGSLGLSFPTISSIGSNGAVIHYTPKKDTARPLDNDLYLVDSGGQYSEGTTDVTRTLHLGVPSDKQKRFWTLVLKGHLQLSRQHFPSGTTGTQVDILARQYLWMNGVNYLHGTGHGVGALLNVHEGPQSISNVPRPNEVALVPGMILSNEPGYYEPNAFGVRIENVVYVKEVSTSPSGPTKEVFYGFEDLTLIPYQKKLLHLPLLEDEELLQLNTYHAKVWSTIAPRLQASQELPNVQQTLAWLREATSPVQRC